MWVGYDDGGAPVFNGDERAYLGEPGSSYEYWVTVPPHQFDALRRALAADRPPTCLTWCAPTSARSWPEVSGPGLTTTE